MNREDLINVLLRYSLLGNECVIDDYFVIDISKDERVVLKSIKINDTQEFHKYLIENKMMLEFPEYIEDFAEDCFKSLYDMIDKWNNDERARNGITISLKFPDSLLILPKCICYRAIDIPFTNYIYGIIGKGIINVNGIFSNYNFPHLGYIYLPSYEIKKEDIELKLGSSIFTILMGTPKYARVYFKNLVGTIGTLNLKYGATKDVLKLQNYTNRTLNLISNYVKNEFKEGYFNKGELYLYDNIFLIHLDDDRYISIYYNQKPWSSGVGIELWGIPGWTKDFEDEYISERGKNILSSGNIKVSDEITFMDSYCFCISEETQEKIGKLNIELSKNLKEIHRNSFNNLNCLEGITILGKPKFHDKWINNCNNLRYINFLSLDFSEFNIKSLVCKDSVILTFKDWNGTLKEYKELLKDNE